MPPGCAAGGRDDRCRTGSGGCAASPCSPVAAVDRGRISACGTGGWAVYAPWDVGSCRALYGIASTSMPRSLATRRGVVRRFSPSIVARTMLCGLVEPRLLVRMSRTPAHSSTARTGPPAITPVPDAAGLRSTRPAPWWPIISWGIVPPVSGISTIWRRAASTALRTASLTSFAFPVAIPTRPCPSPTATSALNPKRRPPFTTLATRLIEITFSTRPSPSRCRSPPSSRRGPPRPRPRGPRPLPPSWSPPRPPRPPRPRRSRCSRCSRCLRPQTRPRPARLPASPVRSPLNLQSTFPGAVGHRLHAPVVLIAGALEHDSGDAALLRLGRDQLSQREALRGLALAVDVDALGAVRRARERDPAGIVHEVRVDVLRRAEHDEPRAPGAPHHLLADPQAPPRAAVLPRPNLMDRSHGSFRGRLGRLARLAADLFAHVADALPLVRLGRPHVADLGRHLAHQLLVHPLDLDEDVVVDRDLDALGRVIRHRVRKAHGELHAERLRLRLVADPLDLELLREALRRS